MNTPLRVMICAGEPSGDVLGAELMASLRALTDRDIEFTGLGGHSMAAQGLKSLFDISDLAVMGFMDVVPKIPVLLRRIRETAEFAVATKPDVLVLVDAPSFAHRVATRVKKMTPDVPIVIYVAPQLWAWRPGRAKHMPHYVDHVLALLPFERAFFEKNGVRTTHVGHPVVERLKNPGQGPAFRARHNIAPDATVLAVLLGSRRKEVSRLAPIFREALITLAARIPHLVLVFPTLPGVEPLVRAALADWPLTTIVTADPEDKFPAFEAADAALAASGTVALEIALAGTPAIIAYKIDWLSGKIGRLLISVKYGNIINLILDREAVPELIQEDCTSAKITAAVERLLNDKSAQAAQRRALKEALAALGRGDDRPSVRAARAVLDTIEK